jgi:hypothetical protein
MAAKEQTNEDCMHDDNVVYMYPPIDMNSESVEDSKYNLDEFKCGIKDASYYAGFFTALVNSGMNTEDAINVLLTDVNIKVNIKLAEINKDTAIQSSKNTALVSEKQMI